MKENSLTNFWEKAFLRQCDFLWIAAKEIASGISNGRIDVVRYLYPGTMVALFFVARGDSLISWLFDCDTLELSQGMRSFVVYTSLSSGWLLWGFQRASQRMKLLSRLESAFSYCGLIANRKYPSFIEDVAVDEYVRKLKLLANGIPLQKFKDNRESLEAHLNVCIVKMAEEVNDKSRITITYALKDLPREIPVPDNMSLGRGEIPIGQSYEGDIKVNLREIGHIAMFGQTTSGKSNALKNVTTALAENNPEADIIFLDFKGGMELADLLNKLGHQQRNFTHQFAPSACIQSLIQIGQSLETRFQEISSIGASTFDEYLTKRKVMPVSVDAHRDVVMRPTYVIVDEIAQLYGREPSVPDAQLKLAREAVNRISRQGRAAAVHLVVATQKPDAQSFDQTVKANMPGVLCFPMTTLGASMSALGSKRACELNPEIKGRAVWKYGPKVTEVQVYKFQ